MKILKIILPFAAIALLSSFAISKFNNSEFLNISKRQLNKKTGFEKTPVDPVYKKFIEKFDKVDLPFSIKFKKPEYIGSYEDNPVYGTQDKNKYLGSSFAEILPEIKNGMMSRLGPDDYMAEALVKTGEKFDAVIYSRNRSYRGPKTFYAATFNKKGDLISKIEIGQNGYTQTKEFSVSKDYQITVIQTNIKSEYLDNINKTKLTYSKPSKDVYFISEDGEFKMQS